MSEVYRYNEADEGKPDILAQRIEGIRASSYARAKSTINDYRKRLESWTEWSSVHEPAIAIARKKWDEMEPGVKSREPVPHDHAIDAIYCAMDPGVKYNTLSIRDKLFLFGPQQEASEQLFSTTVTPYLDPNDPDPLGTASGTQEIVLPDLKAMYAPDHDWYAKIRKGVAEAMGVPASLLEDPKRINFLLGKKPGIGRYYSESIDDGKAPYYSFEET